ncbi:MAG: DICT sensory domain-containing protein [Cyanobacteriota bacterium]|nr:DICT sensory domain-containing protein [Cyanobacteriota bacterium]
MKPESTLNQLKTALPNGQLPSSFGVYYKNTLVALCHALEDHILQTSNSDPDQHPLVLVTFQEGKWYLQEAERYNEIAPSCRHVAIAALPDSGFVNHRTGQLENVSLVHLDKSDDLIQEWNLIVLAPGYTSMVLCYELSEEEYLPYGLPTVDSERKFYGLWTFDSQLVRQAAEILIERVYPYDSDLANRLKQQHQDVIGTTSTTIPDLSGVVSRIVTYLQTSQQELIAVNRQSRELRQLEGQAKRVSRNINANKLQAFLRMAQRVDERDKDNPCASMQVSALCETLGQLLDLPTVELRRLRLAGLLHRIGLASAPPEIFTQSSEEMDDATLAFWKERAVIGARLLETMPELAIVMDVVKHHLEHWDGSGKPDGQQGEEINIKARILGLVSHFQRRTKPWGNRPAFSLSEALAQCQELSGTRFDPQLVESLTTVVKLSEVGLMQLPDRPSQLPNVWLEENPSVDPIKSN